jgi:hypothetical protein
VQYKYICAINGSFLMGEAGVFLCGVEGYQQIS